MHKTNTTSWHLLPKNSLLINLELPKTREFTKTNTVKRIFQMGIQKKVDKGK